MSWNPHAAHRSQAHGFYQPPHHLPLRRAGGHPESRLALLPSGPSTKLSPFLAISRTRCPPANRGVSRRVRPTQTTIERPGLPLQLLPHPATSPSTVRSPAPELGRGLSAVEAGGCSGHTVGELARRRRDLLTTQFLESRTGAEPGPPLPTPTQRRRRLPLLRSDLTTGIWRLSNVPWWPCAWPCSMGSHARSVPWRSQRSRREAMLKGAVSLPTKMQQAGVCGGSRL